MISVNLIPLIAYSFVSAQEYACNYENSYYCTSYYPCLWAEGKCAADPCLTHTTEGECSDKCRWERRNPLDDSEKVCVGPTNIRFGQSCAGQTKRKCTWLQRCKWSSDTCQDDGCIQYETEEDCANAPANEGCQKKFSIWGSFELCVHSTNPITNPECADLYAGNCDLNSNCVFQDNDCVADPCIAKTKETCNSDNCYWTRSWNSGTIGCYSGHNPGVVNQRCLARPASTCNTIYGCMWENDKCKIDPCMEESYEEHECPFGCIWNNLAIPGSEPQKICIHPQNPLIYSGASMMTNAHTTFTAAKIALVILVLILF